MQVVFRTKVLATLILGIATNLPAMAQKIILSNTSTGRVGIQAPVTVPSRVVEAVDDSRMVKLIGNTHPMAKPIFDKGLVDPSRLFERMVLVLKRSPEQEKALADFNERQYDATSPDFHHWLSAREFGKLYGPSDSDMAAVTSWLQNHGFTIVEVTKGRVSIQFTGTAAQVQEAFHVEMHNYLVDGKEHIANDRDPEIPQALAPVITGVASLHDFFPKHASHPGNYVRRDMKTGKYTEIPKDNTPPTHLSTSSKSLVADNKPGGVQPEFGYVDASTGYQREMLTPYDVATIYNILPLWNASTPINGKGVTVAVDGLSDVEQADLNTFRKSFGLPPTTLTTLHSGADPGFTDSQGENSEDTEMVSATAPGAKIVLVSDVSNATTNGLITGITYIVDNEIAPIVTMSYLQCELGLGTAGNTLFNNTFQQAATSGISAFVSAGDSGSALCTLQDGTPPYADSYGLMVNGMASTPYVTGVGGTDLQWPFVEATNPPSDYWNATNAANGSSAKGYMPEMTWNDTCSNPLLLNVYPSYTSVEALCNAAIQGSPGLVEMGAGSGGVSACTTPSGNTPGSCAGGYAKPKWQTGVTGIPADGKRDVPDVSFFAAYGFQDSTGVPGSALLICDSSGSPDKSCNYSDPTQIIYQENGGTSAASPMTAGIMALILQKTGKAQGLANPVFYQLAAKENYASCNSNTVKPGNSCIFYDTTSGSNAMVCYPGDPNCVTKTSGDSAGILSGYSAKPGYDLTTGLGSMNVANLVNAWPASVTPTATLTPPSVSFPSTKVNSTSATTETVTLKNTSTVALSISNIELTGADYTSYGATTTCETTMAAGASCTITISFKPLATGTLTANLVITDNTASGSQTTTISGLGATGTTPAPAVTLSPASLTFASTTVGSTTAAQVVTVKNTGTASLNLTSETISGTNPGSFVKSATNCGTSLAAGASCTVSVAFKPAAMGTLTAALSIADNATGSPQSVKLTGTGAAASTKPTLVITPASIAFPVQIVGTTSDAQIVTVKNSSTATVTLSSIVAGSASFPEINNCGATLAAGASCSLFVAFDPASAAAISGAITVTDNASGSPQKVTLTGTGTAAPSVKLSTTSLTFAATTHGTTSDALPVTLTNSGKATLTLTSISITGTNPADFEELNTCGATLAPGANCIVYVGFKPTAAASYKATLSIVGQGTSSPQSVALSGTGK